MSGNGKVKMTPEQKAIYEMLTKVSRDKIQSYSFRIEQIWYKSLEGIFAVGDLLIRAKKDLSKDKRAYDLLLNILPFGARTAQRLVVIAQTPHFRKPQVQKCLPASWTILDELSGLSESKFNRYIKNDTINTGMNRNEARALAKSSSKRNVVESDVVDSSRDGDNTYASLIFSLKQSSDYSNQKTLMDAQFICNLICDLFENSTGKSKVKVSSDSVKPSKKLRASEKVFVELIAQVRKVENHNRKLQGKAPLSKLQEIMTLFGIDPDNLGKNGFSLLERLAVSYAKRHGIDCIKEDQLKWYAARSDVEPELLGSFIEDLEIQVAKLTSSKSSKRGSTKIYELDADEDEVRQSRSVFAAHRSS